MQKWMFNSGGCEASHDFGRKERIDFLNPHMTAFMEELPVMTGMTVYRLNASGRGRFSIMKPPAPTERGRIVIGALFGGRGTFRMDGTGEHDWRSGGRAYSMTPVDRYVRYDINADEVWQCVAIRIEGEALETLAQDSRLPILVRDGLEGRARDHVQSRAMTPALHQLTQELLRPTYAGSLQSLYRQAKALEFTAHHFDLLAREEHGGLAPTSRELIRVRMAREKLHEDLRQTPNLEDLAASVGLSPRRLNAGFRAIYGTTVFDYLRNARMDAARKMLDEGLDLPLKKLAWDVGYGQATNFVTAFRRRYGITPGHYRRHMRSGG